MPSPLLWRCVRFVAPACAALFLYVLGPAGGSDLAAERYQPPDQYRHLALPGTNELQVIVQLEEPSLVEALTARPPLSAATAAEGPAAQAPVTSPRRLNFNAPRATVQQARIAAQQQQVSERLMRLGRARIDASVGHVLNALIARVPADQYSKISAVPGVRKVTIARPRALALDASAVIHNAPDIWSRVGGAENAGKGIKIGIIDTGIDIDHPMFIDDTLQPPAGYPKGETEFTNKKVIVARNYIHLLARTQTVNTAIDEVGHGTFVGGCAAGKRVDAPLATISGTAPGAFLANYKVFGTPGINDRASDAAVIAAVNDAVKDGMDVLNLSLGALDYISEADDPEVAALNNAVAAGVIVVNSAGNDGPGLHTIGNPGTASNVITVGATSNSRYFASSLRVTGPGAVPDALRSIAYVPGNGPSIRNKIPATAVVDIATLEPTGLGCSSLPAGSLSGKVALISRGTCTFPTKVGNASAAGAAAVIVYNNVTGADPVGMGSLSDTTIPAVMISNPNGLALKSFVGSNPGASVEIDESTALAARSGRGRVMTGFTSRGPGSDFNIKPDLVATGENIYSAAQNNEPKGSLYSAGQYTIAQGTSFSAPIVAGAAAVLKQLYPALGPGGVKSALTTTASREFTLDGTNPPDVLQAGAGLLDLRRASAVTTLFSPTNFSFGEREYTGTVTVSRTVNLSNISGSTEQFAVTIENLTPAATVAVNKSNTGTIPAGATTSVDFSIRVSAPFSGAVQGFVVFQNAAGAVYRIPYWAALYTMDRSRILTISRSAAGAYRSLAEAFQAARPGNVIELADSDTFTGGVVAAINGEGLPLHGITIRGAAGKTPVIDGSGITANASLHLIGLRNVLIQDIVVTGGLNGILITQTASSNPSSVTIDRCRVLNVRDGSESAAIVVDNGGSVSVTNTTVSGATGAAMYVIGAMPLNVVNSTFDGNGSGVRCYGCSVQMLSSTVNGTAAPGAYLWGSAGTLHGNTFSRSSGTFGDGLEIVDGDFTVVNNSFTANARAGIGLFSSSGGTGPTALLTGNTAKSNSVYGILVNPGRNVRIDGNFVSENGRGIRMTGASTGLLVNNIVVRSTDGSNGDGIQAAGTSNVRLVNNTVCLNKRKGLVLSAGARMSVVNTIASDNEAGDVENLTAENVQYSLIGDGALTSANNVAGRPRFVDADKDLFDLATGSPALDTGLNTADGLPFLDGARRLRIASLGARAGEGRVDMGALEAGANYPLIFPLLANGPQPSLADGDDFTTGFAALNKNADPVPSGFTGHTASGGMLAGTENPSNRTFAPGGQVPILGFQLFGFDTAASQLGAVLANTARRLTGFFLVFDRGFGRVADGVDVSDTAGTDLVLMRHQNDAGGRTSYSLFNPTVNPANVTATLMDATGSPVGAPRPMLIPPKGQSVFAFKDVTLSSGYVRVQSDRPISGLELFGNAQELSALRAAFPGSDASLCFPHFAVNQGFTTLIGIVNSAGAAAELMLTAYDSSGNALGAPVTRRLSAGAQLLEPVSSLFNIAPGAMVTGYIMAESDQSGLTGFTSFRYTDGRVVSAAAVPASSNVKRQLLFSHIAHNVAAGSGTYQTGIALLNPFGTAVSITIRVFDGAGNRIRERNLTLGPREKVAKFLSHAVPEAGFFDGNVVLGSGHVEVLSEYGLLGFELFYTNDFSQLASVPAQ